MCSNPIEVVRRMGWTRTQKLMRSEDLLPSCRLLSRCSKIFICSRMKWRQERGQIRDGGLRGGNEGGRSRMARAA